MAARNNTIEAIRKVWGRVNKDIELVGWYGIIFFSIVNLVFFLTLPPCSPKPGLCMRRTMDGSVSYGRCEDIKGEYYTPPNNTILLNTKCPPCPILTKSEECPPCPYCHKTAAEILAEINRTHPDLYKCPEPDICPVCVNTTCPECQVTDDMIQAALNWRMRHSEAPICQRCASIAKRELLGDIMELEGVSKYNEGPSVSTKSIFQGQWSRTQELEQETYNFKNLGGYFLLNRTPDEKGRPRWGWNDADCKGSVLRINYL
jgi:hypothetical protein